MRKTGIEKVIAVAGGGALNCGLIASIEKELGAALLVPPQPRMINALGAAIIAAEMYKKLKG